MVDLHREIASERFRLYLDKNRQRALDLFRKLDVNRDGTLCKSEFRAGIAELKIPFTAQEVDGLFKRYDHDSSGRLEYKELFKGLRAQKLGRVERNQLIDLEESMRKRGEEKMEDIVSIASCSASSVASSRTSRSSRTRFTPSVASSRSSLSKLSLGGRAPGKREALVQRVLALEEDIAEERYRASQTRKAMVKIHAQLERSTRSQPEPQKPRRRGKDEFFGRRGCDLTRIREEQGKSKFWVGGSGNESGWGRVEYFPRRSCEIVRQVSDHRAGKQAPSNRTEGPAGRFRRKRTDLTDQAESLVLFQQAQKMQREYERDRLARERRD